MRQHSIPQFLLRAWTGEDHRLQVFRIGASGLRSRRRAPRGVASRKNVYSFNFPKNGKVDPHVIETTFLQRVDDKGAKVRRKLLSPEVDPLTSEEVKDWALFLMSLRARQPHVVKLLRETGEKTLLHALDVNPEEYRAVAEEGDPEILSEWVAKNMPPAFVENRALSQFPTIAMHPPTLERILTIKHQNVVDVSGCSEHLLLSDDPCIWIYGFDHPGFTVALPISPHAVFIATASDAAYWNLRRLSKHELIKNVNRSSVDQAREYVYASDASPCEFIRDRVAARV